MTMNNIRRMMYVSGEDFYVMTYITLFLLEDLIGKKSQSKCFKDHRKMTYLIQLLLDNRLINIIKRYENREIYNIVDKEFLFDSFSRSEQKKNEVEKLLKMLNHEGYIELIKSKNPEVYDIRINSNNIPESFFNNDAFKDVKFDIKELKSSVKRINVLTHSKFIENVYQLRGLNLWAF
ncbi:hypothetical protein QTV35_003689 [Vibrio parahaemolyticus]|nr:hypothetical protein [Vibrio parahaemolyticus]EHK0063637.1 hypothetical protein [Vibrio parahaemolyticus]ELA9439043.1 hypothetical protein [Vibrio parahaemolyticus]